MTPRLQSPPVRRIARLFGRLLLRWAENNDDARMDRNGELWLLRELLTRNRAASRPSVVFDAGANRGEYTATALAIAAETRCPVEIHVFEPSPRCLDALRGRFGTVPNVRIVGAAVGDSDGTGILFGGSSGTTHASLLQRPALGPDAADGVSVPRLRLDRYLDASSIRQVTFLKLDVEGYELAALRGLGERLDPEVVEVVQFEYGGATLDAGATLRDLYALLESRGYTVCKLFPRAVEVRPYREWMEQFAYANYVALAPRWLGDGRKRA